MALWGGQQWSASYSRQYNFNEKNGDHNFAQYDFGLFSAVVIS